MHSLVFECGVASVVVMMINFLKACYRRVTNSGKNIVITIGLIGTMVFGYLTWNYLVIVPSSLLPISLYVSIYYSIGTLLAISIGFIIVGLLR